MTPRPVRKLLLFTAGFALAALGAWYLPRDAFAPCAAAACLALGLLALLRRGEVRPRALLFAAGLAAGLFWCVGYDALVRRPAAALAGEAREVTVTARSYPSRSENGRWLSAYLTDEGGRRHRADLYLAGFEGEEIRPGDRVTLTARLLATEESWYAARGVFLRAYVYSGYAVEPRERLAAAYLPAESAHRLETALDALLAPEESALVKALVLGERSGISDERETAFARSGLAHVMSVSGLHVTFLIGMLALLLGRGRRRTALVCIPLAILFAGMAGFPASACRAVMMNLCFLAAPLFRRESDGPTALAAAALLLLLQNPFSIAGVGFQLSFAATAGLLAVSQSIYDGVRPRLPKPRGSALSARLTRGFFSSLTSSLSLTLGATLFSAPLVALYFHYFSLVGLLANLLLLWLFGLTFVLGLAAAVLGAAHLPAGGLLSPILGLCARLLGRGVELLSSPVLAALDTTNPYYLAWLALVYALVLAWVLPKKRPRLRLPLLLGALALALAVGLSHGQEHYAEVTVRVLDVGQGQCAALTSRGACAVVDCGGDAAESAGDTAADALANLGESRIDLLVLTHLHSDHTNGLGALFARTEVAAVYAPACWEEDAGALTALAAAEGCAVYWVERETTIALGAAVLTLYPPAEPDAEDENDRSMAVLCSAGSYDALFTGDLNAPAEEALAPRLPDIELLVAGHHGSRHSTSADFLARVRPETAVVSCGAGNSYGHPHGAVLQRLLEAGCAIYRTDRNGTVTIRVR